MPTLKKQSAGLLAYRFRDGIPEVLLVHPGGPFWARKDAGAWSIPKGEFSDGEDPLSAARREFTEETGHTAGGPFLALRPVIQKGGKTVYAWAVEQDLDPARIQSNMFEMEWPPKSGHIQAFPEIDRGAWFAPEAARQKLNERQCAWIDELLAMLRPAV